MTVKQQAARQELKVFLDAVKLRLRSVSRLRGSKQWLDGTRLALRVYRLTRRLGGPELVKCAAMTGAGWRQDILSVEDVVLVIREALLARGIVLRPADTDLLEATIRDRDSVMAEAQIGHIEQTKGARLMDFESTLTDEGREVRVTLGQLRERIRKHLSGRVEGVDPGQVADDLVRAVAIEASDAGSRGGNGSEDDEPTRGRGGHRKSASRQDPLVARALAATALDRYGTKRSVRALRLALAGHQEIVKRCVAERLLRHRTFDELADMLHLERTDVEFILEKLRPWVAKFTSFFERDWYWKDDGTAFDRAALER